MEVFPALVLPSFEPAFYGRRLGPRYNPARRKTFTLAHWHRVVATVRRLSADGLVAGLAAWADDLARIAVPRKADQDTLNAVLCALIGLHWRFASRAASIMLGDRTSGYMIAPASAAVRARLEAAATVAGIMVDVDRPQDAAAT